MQKTFIFKSQDGQEISIRGSKGAVKMNQFEREGMVSRMNVGGIVSTITTKYRTLDELKEALNS